MGIEIKVVNDWRGVGRPQVAMRRSCNIFSVIYRPIYECFKEGYPSSEARI